MSAAPTSLGLTARQAQVMDSFLRVGNPKLVARELGIAENTVRNLLAESCRRLQAANRVLAALTWYQCTVCCALPASAADHGRNGAA